MTPSALRQEEFLHAVKEELVRHRLGFSFSCASCLEARMPQTDLHMVTSSALPQQGVGHWYKDQVTALEAVGLHMSINHNCHGVRRLYQPNWRVQRVGMHKHSSRVRPRACAHFSPNARTRNAHARPSARARVQACIPPRWPALLR